MCDKSGATDFAKIRHTTSFTRLSPVADKAGTTQATTARLPELTECILLLRLGAATHKSVEPDTSSQSAPSLPGYGVVNSHGQRPGPVDRTRRRQIIRPGTLTRSLRWSNNRSNVTLRVEMTIFGFTKTSKLMRNEV
jgi:hypothetical protein